MNPFKCEHYFRWAYGGNNAARFKGHGQAMLDFSSAETPVDALVMVGDNTMNAQEIEYMLLYGLMRKYLTVDNVLIAPGNHELCKTDAYEKYYKRFMDYNNAFLAMSMNTPISARRSTAIN